MEKTMLEMFEEAYRQPIPDETLTPMFTNFPRHLNKLLENAATGDNLKHIEISNPLLDMEASGKI